MVVDCLFWEGKIRIRHKQYIYLYKIPYTIYIFTYAPMTVGEGGICGDILSSLHTLQSVGDI